MFSEDAPSKKWICKSLQIFRVNLNDIWKIDLASVTGELTWEEIKVKGKPPIPRHGHTMNALGHFLIIFGGVTDKNLCLNKLVVYNSIENEW